MCPEIVDILLKPALTHKLLGANLFLMANVILLDLNQRVAEVAS